MVSSAATVSGWQAELALGFVAREGRSVLERRRHLGPLQVQRPFYPEGDAVCHVYLLHPPGGVVGGDQLHIDISVDAGAHALVTTPAAGKLYRSAGRLAAINQQLNVAADAVLEWLPQETIVFDGAHAEVSTQVHLAATANFIGWEIVCLGRPASNEVLAHGLLRQRFEIWRDGVPVWVEASRYCGGAAALDASWGLRGHSVSGTLVCTTVIPELVTQVRESWAAIQGDTLVSATQLDKVLVCRYLGDDAERARALFAAAWAVLRPAVLGRPTCAPRIWAT
jgi:urease accessory protein